MVSNKFFLTAYEPRELKMQNISSLVTTAVKHQTCTKTKEETRLFKPRHITLEKQPADRLTLSRGHFLKVCLRDFSNAPVPPLVPQETPEAGAVSGLGYAPVLYINGDFGAPNADSQGYSPPGAH